MNIQVHDIRKKWILLVCGLVMGLVLVCAPRFNRMAIPPLNALSTHELGDASAYIAYVEHFRGEEQGEALHAPFSYRPLVPLLAAALPFAPMTAINLINLGALFVALLALLGTLSHLGFGIRAAALGGLAFVVSFPTFYYGAIGYIDPGILCLLSLGAWAILRENRLATLLVLCVGAFCKESIILLLPALAACCFTPRSGKGHVSLRAFTGITAGTLALIWLSRFLAPGVSDYVWMPSMEWFLGNLSRPRALLSFALSFSYPGLLALLFIYGHHQRVAENPALRVLSFGFMGTLVFSLAGASGAHLDGRIIWLSYPFSIPLALMFVLERGWLRQQSGELQEWFSSVS